jgi:hypothetical protein
MVLSDLGSDSDQRRVVYEPSNDSLNGAPNDSINPSDQVGQNPEQTVSRSELCSNEPSKLCLFATLTDFITPQYNSTLSSRSIGTSCFHNRSGTVEEERDASVVIDFEQRNQREVKKRADQIVPIRRITVHRRRTDQTDKVIETY